MPDSGSFTAGHVRSTFCQSNDAVVLGQGGAVVSSRQALVINDSSPVPNPSMPRVAPLNAIALGPDLMLRIPGLTVPSGWTVISRGPPRGELKIMPNWWPSQ
jgi:hypothetical protein